MRRGRDPVEARAGDDRDLYEITEWDTRSTVDRLAVLIYGGAVSGLRALVVVLAVLILVAQFALGGLGALTDPLIGLFTLLSAVPALVLAVYVWRSDVTESEPLELLVATFALGVLFAGFASIGNTALNSAFAQLGLLSGMVATVGQAAFFYLVVGPVEESVKLLAVRLYAFRKPPFDAVLDGAVYGAVAGLGFATIENAVYITQTTAGTGEPTNLLAAGGAIAAVRALAGPGHVIYSAFAGYYLGLAKFNREQAGPIVIKGLLIAAFIHGTYNVLAGFAPGLIAAIFDIPPFLGLIGFVVAYDTLFGLILLRKLNRYRDTYRQLHAAEQRDGSTVDLTEFDG